MILRSLAIWLLLIAAEILHGIARAVLLVPHVGEFRSSQICVFTGSLIILGIALVSVRWIGATRTSQLLGIGSLWLVLTLAFEFLFGHFVAGASWERGRPVSLHRAGRTLPDCLRATPHRRVCGLQPRWLVCHGIRSTVRRCWSPVAPRFGPNRSRRLPPSGHRLQRYRSVVGRWVLASLPFLLAGGIKVLYDLLLYRSFVAVRPPEELH
jgi:hypothetical protein